MSEPFTESETAVDAWSGERPQQATAEPATFAVSADDFSALEERVHRAVDLVKRERQARAAAEQYAADAESKVLAQAAMVEQLQNELNGLRAERDQVRQRVERLLKQLDTLEV